MSERTVLGFPGKKCIYPLIGITTNRAGFHEMKTSFCGSSGLPSQQISLGENLQQKHKALRNGAWIYPGNSHGTQKMEVWKLMFRMSMG